MVWRRENLPRQTSSAKGVLRRKLGPHTLSPTLAVVLAAQSPPSYCFLRFSLSYTLNLEG